MFSPPPSLGLPLLAVLLVEILLASLFPITWWVRSERFSLLYDRVFLPATPEASFVGSMAFDGIVGSS